jgi:hypothetical protein
VTYRQGLDWIIEFIDTLSIHTTRDYRQYSAIADLYILLSTDTRALGFSVFISRILATDFITMSLSLQIAHEVFVLQPNSFLAISSQAPSTAGLLNSISRYSQDHILAGWRLESQLSQLSSSL